MKTRKVFVAGGSFEYINWMNAEAVSSIDEADFVVFTGGEDVDPSLYDSTAHPSTSSNLARDHKEFEIFVKAKAKRKPMVGICRGAQFLCAVSGGILVQDQSNPHFIHKIKTYDGKEIFVSSSHHQAQYPWVMDKDKFLVLGWSVGISDRHENGHGTEIVKGIIDDDKEVEDCWYIETNCLGIQSHPEMIYERRQAQSQIAASIKHHQELLEKFLTGTLEVGSKSQSHLAIA